MRLVQIIRRRDRFRDLLAVLRLVRVRGGLDDRFEQCAVGIRHRRDEFLRRRESAAGMSLPDILGQDVDEADTVIDCALVHRVRPQEAVDIVGAQIGDHFRRRHRADLHVDIRVEAVLGEIVAQQVVVHRVIEGHRELETLPVPGIALVLVLDRERDRLAVDIFDRRHGVGQRIGARAHGDGERHRGEHVRGVVFLVDGLVANHRPARGLDDFDVEAVLGVKPHRRRHDDRGGAGDRNEADLEVLLLQRAALRKCLGRGSQRKKLR